MAQQPANPVERVVLQAPVTELLLLDAAAYFVGGLGAELDDVEASSTAAASGSSPRIAFA